MPQSHTYHPRITFQDTNVVGNVYFLTFFRWQAESRDQWLRASNSDMWNDIFLGKRKLLVTHWSTNFEDAFGATLGDDIVVTLNFTAGDDASISAIAEVMKTCEGNSTRIAFGNMRFTTRADLVPRQHDYLDGTCYSLIATPTIARAVNSLELLSLQGKCRELFLADHAADTLRRVARRSLILQTTAASLELVQVPPEPIDQIRVEMRLDSLKCGQMGVRFDYFTDLADGTYIRFAKGSQKMSSKQQSGSVIVPCPFPADLLLALREFTQSEQLLRKLHDILRFSSSQRVDVGALSFEANK